MSINFPPPDDDAVPQAQCADTTAQGNALCTQAGAICIFDDVIERPYRCTASAGLGSSTSNGNITCKFRMRCDPFIL